MNSGWDSWWMALPWASVMFISNCVLPRTKSPGALCEVVGPCTETSTAICPATFAGIWTATLPQSMAPLAPAGMVVLVGGGVGVGVGTEAVWLATLVETAASANGVAPTVGVVWGALVGAGVPVGGGVLVGATVLVAATVPVVAGVAVVTAVATAVAALVGATVCSTVGLSTGVAVPAVGVVTVGLPTSVVVAEATEVAGGVPTVGGTGVAWAVPRIWVAC